MARRIDPDWRPPSNPFFKYIYNRTKLYNFNYIQVITGDPGSGKSWTALRMGESIDPRFTINNVCYDPKDFIEKISNAKYKGEVYVLDEAGLSHSSRTWQSITNLMINRILQTFRYKNLVTLFVVPNMNYIDSQARDLIHVHGEVTRKSDSVPKLRLHFISRNRKTGETYWVRPRIMVDGSYKALSTIVMQQKPSKMLIDDYEKKMTQYKDAVLKSSLGELKQLDKELVTETKSIQDDVEYIKKHIEDYMNRRNNLDLSLIMADLKIGRSTAMQIKRLVERDMKQIELI